MSNLLTAKQLYRCEAEESTRLARSAVNGVCDHSLAATQSISIGQYTGWAKNSAFSLQ